MLLNEKNNIIFGKSIAFKYDWRTYQEKFLHNFEKHLVDDHLHVIAPPGAGKTILGLEMLVRINKKTLVLSPSLTIKDQWHQKFKSFFDSDNKFENISSDIKNLKGLNFSTYQGLFALRKNFDTTDSFINYFKSQEIDVLVLDEAHHLKSEWWKVLFELKEHLDLIIISLTATPPFDSSKAELSRYFNLCGEVDEEISIPELVKERALCPHQDFVYFSKPDDKEIEYIFTYRKRIASFVKFLKENQKFIQFLKSHPFYTSPKENSDEIYDDPSYYSAILIFLNECGEVISNETLEILGLDKKDAVEFPILDINWAEVLLQKILFDNRVSLIQYEALLSKVEQDLKKIGGIHRKKVNLLSNETIFKKITNSANKLNSIVSIANFETAQLKDDLRLVILTDFIRKEFLGLNEDYTKQINRIGVVPIFHYLKKYLEDTSSIAVLSGSLVIVNSQCLKALEGYFTLSELNVTKIENDSNFVEISIGKSSKNKIVKVITELFEQGIIKILIGTKALLGEGWDAPSINTLILASNIGSFVSSNQMRGRAIRVKDKGKTGHIWHLASIDKTNKGGGEDVEKLTQRFDAFVGLSYDDYTIENGIERLNFPVDFQNEDMALLNEQYLQKAKNRKELVNDWDKAILNGFEVKKIVSIDYLTDERLQKQKAYNNKNIVRYTFIELGIGISYFTFEYISNNLIHLVRGNFILFLKYFIISLFVAFIPKTFKAIKTYYVLGNIPKLIKKIGKAVLQTMLELNYIKTSFNNISIEVVKDDKGGISCFLIGASYYENSIFVTSLNEILGSIENPRYIILRKNWMKDKAGIYNVHAIPKIAESNKKTAELFHRNWKKYVGRSELFFTRNTEGRKLMLKAKIQNLKYVSHKNNTSKTEILWK